MASDVNEDNRGGDSSRCHTHRVSSSTAIINKSGRHMTDASGEHHNEDVCQIYPSEFQNMRYINPAIYVETITSTHSLASLNETMRETLTPHPHTPYRTASTPFLTNRTNSTGYITRKSCKLTGQSPRDGEETMRFMKSSQMNALGSDNECFRLSVTSLSTTTTSQEERENAERRKQIAYKEWLAKKEQEKRERQKERESLQRELEKQQSRCGRLSKEQRDEHLRQWAERKKAAAERERLREERAKARIQKAIDEEQRRKAQAKEEKLNEWIKKKEEEHKENKVREEVRATAQERAEQRRRTEGKRAYHDWLRLSKNKPLPVPLNRGVLSMRGSVSDMYINPIPWQPLT